MTRVKRVTGYWRLIPDPLATDPHAELLTARKREFHQSQAEMEAEIGIELEREFYVEMAG